MKYFINKEQTKMLGYDETGKIPVQEFELAEYFVSVLNSGGVVLVSDKRKKRMGRSLKAGKPGYGAKSRSIEYEVNQGLSVKEICKKLCKKFPTITPQDVYQVRGKMKKAVPSDTFTGPSSDE